MSVPAFYAIYDTGTYLLKVYQKLHISFLLLGALLMLCSCQGIAPRTDFELSETFDTDADWQLSTDASATIAIENGVLLVEVHIPGQVAWTAHPSTWQNFQLTVTTEQLSGPLDNEYGVLIRMDNDTSFYVLSISGDGYARAALFNDEVWTVLGSDWTPHASINQGHSSNSLSVTAQDSTLTFSVNGEVVLDVEDATLTKGTIGLYAGAFGEGGVVIAFDDLVVTSIP